MRLTREAIQYIEDEFDSLRAQIDELEEELEKALEESAEKDELIAALKAQIQLMTADRSVVA